MYKARYIPISLRTTKRKMLFLKLGRKNILVFEDPFKREWISQQQEEGRRKQDNKIENEMLEKCMPGKFYLKVVQLLILDKLHFKKKQ